MSSEAALRILICDDRSENLEFNQNSILSAVSSLEQSVAVETLTGSAFVEQIRILERRRDRARDGLRATDAEVSAYEPSRFDEFDIIVLDYDLLKLNEAVDGETTAYRVRCYSTAPYVVVINETRVTNEFDLRMLPRLESSADLLCNSRDLGNRGLWSPSSYGYRPWLWPVLPAALKVRRDLISLLLQEIDTPLVQLMEMPSAVIDALPPDLVDVLTGDGRFTEVTAKNLCESELGYRRDDSALTLEAVARVAAAALAAWVTRLVVAGQEHLTDIPHLLDRFPSLGRVTEQEAVEVVIPRFNSIVFSSTPLDCPELEGLLLPPPFADKPMWWSRLLSRDRRILEVRSPSTAVRPAAVFCEDVSLFVAEENAIPFIVDLPTRLKQRFAYGPSQLDPGSAEQGLQMLTNAPPAKSEVTRNAEAIEPVTYVPARRLLND